MTPGAFPTQHLPVMTITPLELKARLDAGEKIRLVDVREQEEWAVARLPGAELIPLSSFQQRGPAELDPDDALVLYCHHGIRSARAQSFLQAQGYSNVTNLTGGIDAWATTVDPTMRRY
jgi:adenylyltransferase/sulfurtransferase